MEGAIVTLIPADGSGTGSFGHADKNGDYQVSTYRSGDGAPAGDYLIAITWGETVDRLKGAYADPTKTRLKATVQPQENELNFDLQKK
jgi:hypothetical protein